MWVNMNHIPKIDEFIKGPCEWFIYFYLSLITLIFSIWSKWIDGMSKRKLIRGWISNRMTYSVMCESFFLSLFIAVIFDTFRFFFFFVEFRFIFIHNHFLCIRFGVSESGSGFFSFPNCYIVSSLRRRSVEASWHLKYV